MLPLSWPTVANLHPLAPADTLSGYAEMVSQLESWLSVITGFHRTSIQPNAGSQGEYAGLLAIRGYHTSQRPGPPERLPHPRQRPRHQPRQCGHVPA